MKRVQAIVLVNDKGDSLYPFSDVVSGYLLPVANKPTLAYVVERLVENHFQSIIFVCNQFNREEIEKFVERRFVWPEGRAGKCVFYAPDCYETTVKSIAKLHENGTLVHDFLVIAGDTLTDCRLVDFVLSHSGSKSLLTVAFCESRESKDVLLSEPGTSNLFKLTSVEELEAEGLKVKKVVAKRVKEIELRTGLKTANICMFSQSLLGTFKAFSDEFGGLFEEFIPFVVEHQFHKRLKETFDPAAKDGNSGGFERCLATCASKAERLLTGHKMQFFEFKGYVRHVRLLSDYLEANLDAIAAFHKESLFSPTANSDRKAPAAEPVQRGPVNIFGSNAEVPQSKDIKRSVFGRNARVHQNCKIENSVILNDVEIEENCDISDSIIGSKCTIGAGTKISKCSIGHSNKIKEKSNFADDLLRCETDADIPMTRKLSTI